MKQLVAIAPATVSVATTEEAVLSSETAQQLPAAPVQTKFVIRRNVNAVSSNTAALGPAAVK